MKKQKVDDMEYKVKNQKVEIVIYKAENQKAGIIIGIREKKEEIGRIFITQRIETK